MAVLKALIKFKLHILGITEPVQVLTDHANLIYWKDPRKVNQQLTHWLKKTQDYNIVIQHILGKQYDAADALSHQKM